MKAWVSFSRRIVVLGLAVCIQGILRKGRDTAGDLGVHCKQPDGSMMDSYSQKGRVKTGNGTSKLEDDKSSMSNSQIYDSPIIHIESPSNEITCKPLEA